MHDVPPGLLTRAGFADRAALERYVADNRVPLTWTHFAVQNALEPAERAALNCFSQEIKKAPGPVATTKALPDSVRTIEARLTWHLGSDGKQAVASGFELAGLEGTQDLAGAVRTCLQQHLSGLNRVPAHHRGQRWQDSERPLADVMHGGAEEGPMSNARGSKEHPPRSFRHRVVELMARWYVFIFLNIYGLAKIAGGQFYRRGRLPQDVASLRLGEAPGFELAWTFMGYSFAYILFIGMAEVVGAWLLLWDRTKLLGVAVLLPVMINIIVFDVIFFPPGREYGALASATIYTLLLGLILICNKERVGQAVRALMVPRQPRLPVGQRARTVIAALIVMGLLFAVDQLLVNLFGHGRG